MHCNWLDSISCASQQHGSTWKSSDLSQRSLFQSFVAQIGHNWDSGSQPWPHTRLSCGALKMYSGPGSTSDQWNLWPRIYYFQKKSPGVSTVRLELIILYPVILCAAPQNNEARSPHGSSHFSHHRNSFISSSQHSIWTSSLNPPYLKTFSLVSLNPTLPDSLPLCWANSVYFLGSSSPAFLGLYSLYCFQSLKDFNYLLDPPLSSCSGWLPNRSLHPRSLLWTSGPDIWLPTGHLHFDISQVLQTRPAPIGTHHPFSHLSCCVEWHWLSNPFRLYKHKLQESSRHFCFPPLYTIQLILS